MKVDSQLLVTYFFKTDELVTVSLFIISKLSLFSQK